MYYISEESRWQCQKYHCKIPLEGELGWSIDKLDGGILSVAEKVNNNSGPYRRPRLRLCEWTQVAASANCCLGPSPRCSGITTSSPLTSPPCCYDKPRHCRCARLSVQPTTLELAASSAFLRECKSAAPLIHRS